mmetsp:Transcript_12785/g.26064  ORF Transcript_12785/g.26064 Transcript_12785/m.26064 type:complete len:225 (-) Transcript_12785:2062-2736(-)
MQLLLFLQKAFNFLLLVFDILLQHGELLLHDSVLSLEAESGLPLVCQLLVVLHPEILNLGVYVVLELMPNLVELPLSVILLLFVLHSELLVLIKLLLEVFSKFSDIFLVGFDKDALLRIPTILLKVALVTQVLVPLNLSHDLLLVATLKLLELVLVLLVHLLQPLVVFHLHVVLLLPEKLIFVFVLLEILSVLLRRLLDLLLVVHVLEAELILVVQGQLINLCA